MSIADTKYDLIIIGGGLAGASLAVALANTRYRVAVIEAFSVDSGTQPSYDERTIALTYSARHIFSQLGVWDSQIEADACAIKSIHISNKGHLGLTRLSCLDAGTPALGYVVPTRSLGYALSRQIKLSDNLSFYCPYEATQIAVDEQIAIVTVQAKDTKKTLELNAKLVVIADGGRSNLMSLLGFNKEQHPYSQSALLSIVSTNMAHQNKAYERFMDDGPLALLPMTDQRFAVVWTLSPENLERIESMDDSDYLNGLQEAFGTTAGMFSAPTPRKSYPLARSILNTPYSERVLVLGNAAHTVHPVAGQGFNLGLRDVAALAEQLIQPESEISDIGSLQFLQHYAQTRTQDTQRVSQFTDGLLKIFGHPSPLVSAGRNLGLAVVENLPFVKRALLRRSMGLGKHQPRLARGLKLRHGPTSKP